MRKRVPSLSPRRIVYVRGVGGRRHARKVVACPAGFLGRQRRVPGLLKHLLAQRSTRQSLSPPRPSHTRAAGERMGQCSTPHTRLAQRRQPFAAPGTQTPHRSQRTSLLSASPLPGSSPGSWQTKKKKLKKEEPHPERRLCPGRYEMLTHSPFSGGGAASACECLT